MKILNDLLSKVFPVVHMFTLYRIDLTDSTIVIPLKLSNNQEIKKIPLNDEIFSVIISKDIYLPENSPILGGSFKKVVSPSFENVLWASCTLQVSDLCKIIEVEYDIPMDDLNEL